MKRIERNPIEYLISILIPSIRPEGLDNLINSILQNADNSLNNFEIIVKIDFEELKLYDLSKYNTLDNINFIINSKKQGYISLINFWEDMIQLSHSKYCFILTDDTKILTKNWNSFLQKSLTGFKLYLPFTQWQNVETNPQYCFPIFPKKLLDIWGFLAPHSLVDHWLYEIAHKMSNPNMPWNEPFLEYLAVPKISATNVSDPSKHKEDNTPSLFKTALYHSNSATFFHSLNLLKEYLVKEKYDTILKHNIINEYRGTQD